MIKYFQNESIYKSKYKEVLSYFDWVEKGEDDLNIKSKKDMEMDLVVVTFIDENYAIQYKNYFNATLIKKSDISKFFAISGKS